MAYVNIGGIRKVHGLKGFVKLFIEQTYLEDFLRVQALFLEESGAYLPYFIAERTIGTDILVRFEEYHTREAVAMLVGKSIFIREEEVLSPSERQLETKTLEYAHIQGYEMHDATLGLIGVIQSIEEYPQQEMAIVSYQNRPTLIPLNAVFVTEIQDADKRVLVDLPEGLLDL